MPRIPLVEADQLDDEQRRVWEAIAGTRGRVAGPFAGLLQSPELADRVQRLGAYVRYDTVLGRRRAELAILLTARAWSCQFEWFAHEPHARAAGLSGEVIAAIREGRPPAPLDAVEAAIAVYIGELLEQRDVTDVTHAAAVRELGVKGVVELTVLVGYYTLLAMSLNAHRIGPPDGSAPLPPR